MVKNKIKDNTLIKRKNLVLLLREKGVKRISHDAIKSLEKKLQQDLEKVAEALKEEITIKGKKTLEKEDIEEVFKNLKKEEISWEI